MWDSHIFFLFHYLLDYSFKHVMIYIFKDILGLKSLLWTGHLGIFLSVTQDANLYRISCVEDGWKCSLLSEKSTVSVHFLWPNKINYLKCAKCFKRLFLKKSTRPKVPIETAIYTVCECSSVWPHSPGVLDEMGKWSTVTEIWSGLPIQIYYSSPQASADYWIDPKLT